MILNHILLGGKRSNVLLKFPEKKSLSFNVNYVNLLMLLKTLVLLSKYCSTTALVQQLIHSNIFYELGVLISMLHEKRVLRLVEMTCQEVTEIVALNNKQLSNRIKSV